uniref:Uncharacterized protein n=1 Tax=Romanomermis culicivorax TaxID=13658 RepID=A0A915J771_ROMCU
MKKWSATERECLAIVYGLKLYKYHLIYPEDSEGDPESSSPANLVNAVTTKRMAKGVERSNQAQVQPDGNQGHVIGNKRNQKKEDIAKHIQNAAEKLKKYFDK